jgi:hypothetical protein
MVSTHYREKYGWHTCIDFILIRQTRAPINGGSQQNHHGVANPQVRLPPLPRISPDDSIFL